MANIRMWVSFNEMFCVYVWLGGTIIFCFVCFFHQHDIACSKWVLLIDINYVCVISLICLLNFQIRWWVCTCVSTCGARSNLFLLSFSCMLHCQHQKVCLFNGVLLIYGYMDQRYPLFFLFACSIANISGYVSYVEICRSSYLLLTPLPINIHYSWWALLLCDVDVTNVFSLSLLNFTPLPTVGGEFTEWFVACVNAWSEV